MEGSVRVSGMTKILKYLILINLLFIEFDFEIAGVSITSILLFGMALFSYFIYVFLKDRANIQVNISKKLIWPYLIYFLGFSGLIIYHNMNNIVQIIKYIGVLLVALIIFLDFYINYKDENNWIKYFNVIIVVAMIIIVIGVFETALDIKFPKRFDSFLWGRSNRMASRFLLIIPPTFYLAKYKDNRYYMPFYVLVFGTFLTVSRGAMLVLALFLLINIGELLKKKNLVKTISAASLTIVISYIVKILQSWLYRVKILGIQISFQMEQEIGQAAEEVASNAAENAGQSISRLVLWKDAIGDFISKPFSGIGIDKFQSYYMYYGKKVGEINAHNWILHILAEVGIIGLVFTLILVISIIYILFKRYKFAKETNDLELKVLTLSAGATTIMYLTHNLIEASISSLMFGYTSGSIIFIIILALALGYKKNHTKEVEFKYE